MARKPGIWWRSSHSCYYCTIGGRKLRLDPDEGKAQRMHTSLIAGAGMPVESFIRPVAKTSELIARFIDLASNRLTDATVANYRYQLARWVETVGDRPVASLCKADVVTHLARFPDWSQSTRSLSYRIIRAWWAWAIEEAGAAPLPRLRLPGIERRQPVSWDDLERWRPFVKPWLVDWVTVGLETGMRPGEQTNICWRDIDVSNRVAIVTGKTGKRLVVLSRLACSTLGRVAVSLTDGPIFRNSKGGVWKPIILGSAFASISDAAGVRIVPYSLRHLFAIRHIEQGTDSLTLARLLGHSNTSMIMKHYGQWSVATLRAAIDRVA